MQVDTLLNEAELEAEITSVKQRLTSRQLEYLTVQTDTVPGNCSVASSVIAVPTLGGEAPRV